MRSYSTWLGIAVTLFLLPAGLAAQGKPGGGGGGGRPAGGGGIPTSSRPTLPNTNIPAPNTNFPSPTFLSGKVVTDDGTPLTDSPVIQTLCLGNLRNEGYADSKGSFSFDLQNNNSSAVVQDVEATSQSMGGFGSSSRNSGARRDLRQCSLQASLPGFRSDMIELASKANETGSADVGTIVLHRLAKVDGLTISVTSAAAPPKAKREYEKGREAETKSKWDPAQQHFAKAVEIYPKYAVAWNELGRMQLQKNDVAGATNSFRQSIAADAKFINPYAGLVEIALKEQKWQQVAEFSDKIVALNPVDFPQYWYDNSLANLFLSDFNTAQKSAERGLANDPHHKVPRLEYLLGIALARKNDYAGGLTHIQNYLRMVPNSSDRGAVDKQVAELQRLTTAQLK